MRVYMVVASTTPWTVWYHPGYLRRALSAYDPESDDPRAHLTNTHFQYKSKAFKFKDHLWPMYVAKPSKDTPTFQQYLAARGITGPRFVQTVLEPRMKRVLKFIVHTAKPHVQSRRGAYQVFGMDFMVDAAFNVFLIEANGYPGFTWASGYDSRELVGQFNDLVTELHEAPQAFTRMRAGDNYGDLSLVYSELEDKPVRTHTSLET